MDVFDRVKALCEQRGISMAEMEREAGLGERSTYNWKRVMPSWDKLEKVADYFNVSIDYLMGRDGKEEKSQGRVLSFQRPSNEFYDLFVSSCANNCLTPEKAVSAVNVDVSRIHEWEQGASPTAAEVRELSRLLNSPLYAIEDDDIIEDIWEVRERLRNQPGMRMLFDATSKATPEELEAVANMFYAMKGNQDE